MLKKSIRAIIIALFICNLFITNIYAEPKMRKTYSINLDSLNINVKQYLTSLVIDDDTKAVYMNNTYVGNVTSDPQTFVLSTTNYSITASVSISNLSCNASVNAVTEKHYTAVFDIQIEDNSYYICNFYPDYSNNPSYSIKARATRNGDLQDFGSFSYTYGNESKTFNVQMTQSDGAVYVNGKNVGNLGNTNIPIVFEYIGSDFPITNIDYQKTLPMFNWNRASQTNTIFYNRNFGDISFKEKYDLSNEYLNLPTVEYTFGATVDEYARVGGTSTTGTGVWQKTGNQIEVVCEYYENNKCGNAIRSEFPRYWAVWASSQDFGSSVSKLSKTYRELVDGYVNYYNTGNWTYLDGAFDSMASGDGVKKQQRSRTKSWSNWSEWTKDYNTLAFNGTSSDVKGEQTEMFKYRTYTWSDVGGWSTNASVCSYISSTDGRAESKTAVDEACGVEKYKSCRTQANGCQTYNSCTSGSCGYAVCRTSGCGCETYSSCRDSSCGTETYQSSTTGCAIYNSKTCYKNCNAHSCNCRTVVDRQYSCNCSSYSCNCKTTSYSCNCKKVCNRYTGSGKCVSYTNSCSTCKSTSCSTCQSCQTCSVTHQECDTCYDSCPYDCSYTTYDAPCYDTRNKSCRTSGCGCETYKECAHQGCGYATCETEACGCATWKNAENSACGVESYKSCTLYKCQLKSFADWVGPRTSCPYLSGVDVECKSDGNYYRYSNKILGDWGSWYNVSSFASVTAEMDFQYRYSTPTIKVEKEKATGYEGSSAGWWSGKKESMGYQDVVHEIANVGGRQYWSDYPYYTKDLVEEFQDKYAESIAGKSIYDTLLGQTDKPYVLWEDFKYKLNSSDAYKTSLNSIKNKELYQPYLYFYAWRFISSSASVPIGSSSKSVIGEQIINYYSNGSLIESEEKENRDTKVIYFDYRDPLTHYKDELPENWQGYEYLVDEIKNSDLDTSKIKVKLSANDILAMKEYLENGGYDNVSDCEMIRQFSYIFVTTDSELQNWLNSGSGCKIGD